MFSCIHDARQLLLVRCKEVTTFVKDDTIAILPTERSAILETLNALEITIANDENVDDKLQSLQVCFSRMAVSVNLERYHALARSIEKAKIQIGRLLQANEHAEHSDTQKFYLYLKHKGLISSWQELEFGNVATVVDAFKRGYLTLPEASDAISASMRCQHQLQLCHLAQARSFTQGQAA
ncbi:hypothetical protein L4D06_23115 [Enterovibrio makurazakiensis]|uniref:hypothetical protein n=1 Tax=Enterovibrio makurazakiensis TaxID=2910232 RepID=UPI003D1D2C55